MKTKKAAAIALFTLTFLLLVVSIIAPFGEEKWRTSHVYEGNADFVQIERVDGETFLSFSTSEGIVLAEKKINGSFTERLMGNGETAWNRTVISEETRSGFYLSMTGIDGEIGMAHQYGSLGDRKLGYTHRVNGSWKTDQVDYSYTGSGLEPGMYASLTRLKDRPVILYHTSEGDQFLKAEKVNGTWEREVLNTNVGQFISTDSCGEKVFVMLRSRSNQSIYRGLLTEKDWESSRVEGDTDAAMSVDAADCTFRAAFHNSRNNRITYIDGDEREEIADGRRSRISLQYTDRPEMTFYRSGEGLFYIEKTEDGWKTTPLDTERSYAGERNDLEISPEGEPQVIYTGGKGVYYTEYGKGSSAELNTIIRILTLLSAIPALASLLYLEEELLVLKSKVFKQLQT